MEQAQYDKGFEARKLVHSCPFGVLATQSLEMPGYPFGSVTPYAIDRNGELIILISELAQHTKNIKNEPRVSLTVVEGGDGDVQAYGRVTYLGTVIRVEDEDEVSARYLRYLPSAKRYFETHDFNFYRIELARARFIGGFGKIFWVEPEEFILPNPFTEEQEVSILSHINNDHQKAMKTYFRKVGVEVSEELKMVGVDAEGVDIRHNRRIFRFHFPNKVSNMEEIREELTNMAIE